jgi:hypothetical protein
LSKLERYNSAARELYLASPRFPSCNTLNQTRLLPVSLLTTNLHAVSSEESFGFSIASTYHSSKVFPGPLIQHS